MRTIHRKEMMQAEMRATPIIHQVSEMSLNTRSPKPLTFRNAPSAVTAPVRTPSLTGLPSSVSPSPNTVLLGSLLASALTTSGRQRPRTEVEGRTQAGQSSFSIRSLADRLFHCDSGMSAQYLDISCLIIGSSEPEAAWACTHQEFGLSGHFSTQT
jgi:hypothetical protein